MKIIVTSPNNYIERLRKSLLATDTLYLARHNYRIQVILLPGGPDARPRNITKGIALAFEYGLDEKPFGLHCSEYDLICNLALHVPQISQDSGLLNIRLV